MRSVNLKKRESRLAISFFVSGLYLSQIKYPTGNNIIQIIHHIVFDFQEPGELLGQRYWVVNKVCF